MEILKKLPFDLQEHILVKVMKRYKLRQGKYVRQIDKTKYAFLEYIIRPYMNKNSFHYHEDIFQDIFDSSEEFINKLYDRRILLRPSEIGRYTSERNLILKMIKERKMP